MFSMYILCTLNILKRCIFALKFFNQVNLKFLSKKYEKCIYFFSKVYVQICKFMIYFTHGKSGIRLILLKCEKAYKVSTLI